jgi:uncharacterized protein GlcG (DUF336 family)
MRQFDSLFVAVTSLLLLGAGAQAQTPPPQPPYGAPITLEQAKKVAAAAEVERKKTNHPLAVAVVEPSGGLVYFERADGTGYASLDIAIRKARTAATFRVPSKVFFDSMGSGNPYAPTLHPDLTASPGGVPIMVGGKIIGAIGVSGFPTGAQDAAVADPAAKALQ